MGLAQLQLQTIKNGPKRLRSILALCWALGFSLALTPQAKAAFTGDYALNRFLLTNTNADGSVATPDGGLSIVLTGGNNGSGLAGTTDLVAAATGAGTVQFQYSYSALDFPGFDFGGYLLDGAFSRLADIDGQSGTALFTVTPGRSFGFRVGTMDNTGEPGILTISNFSAPSGTGSSVPEPGTAPMMLVLAGAAIAAHWRVRRIHRGKEGNA
jgi:hypothetical protein